MIKRATEAKPLAQHGGDRKSENADQVAYGNLKPGSNSADYLTARIARDHPAVAPTPSAT